MVKKQTNKNKLKTKKQNKTKLCLESGYKQQNETKMKQ